MVGYLLDAFSSPWHVWIDLLHPFPGREPIATLLAPLLSVFVGVWMILPDEDGAGQVA